MSGGLTLTRSNFVNQEPYAPALLRLPVVPRSATPVLAEHECMWPALRMAQATYPALGLADQDGWLIYEHTHQLPAFPAGHFNVRMTPNAKYGPSAVECLAGRYSVERHRRMGVRTHLLHANMDKKAEKESDECMVHLFLVDLRKALLNAHLAEVCYNRDGTQYLRFDPLAPGVDKIYERLRVVNKRG